jgi:hypothetical protein
MLKPILKIHKELQKEGCPKRKKEKEKKRKRNMQIWYPIMLPILIHLIFENSIFM